MEKKSKGKNFAITIGNVLIDIGKLAIGGLIFGAALRGSIDPIQIMIFGTALAIPAIVIGVILVAINKE